jgi:hypothetical protein
MINVERVATNATFTGGIKKVTWKRLWVAAQNGLKI